MLIGLKQVIFHHPLEIASMGGGEWDGGSVLNHLPLEGLKLRALYAFSLCLTQQGILAWNAEQHRTAGQLEMTSTRYK